MGKNVKKKKKKSLSFILFLSISSFVSFSPPVCRSVSVWSSSGEPGGTASDRGEAEGEAGPLEVHQALEDPLLHLGGKPAPLPQRQISTWPMKMKPPHTQTHSRMDTHAHCPRPLTH